MPCVRGAASRGSEVVITNTTIVPAMNQSPMLSNCLGRAVEVGVEMVEARGRSGSGRTRDGGVEPATWNSTLTPIARGVWLRRSNRPAFGVPPGESGSPTKLSKPCNVWSGKNLAIRVSRAPCRHESEPFRQGTRERRSEGERVQADCTCRSVVGQDVSTAGRQALP